MVRIHPSIPKLIAHADHTPAPKGSHCKPVATYWKFCNGGDLASTSEKFKSAGVRTPEGFQGYPEPPAVKIMLAGSRLPEAFVWRCFQQMLAVLNYLHQLDPPVAHRDVFDANIFLDWLSDTSTLPDFYLGDFGHAASVGDKASATTATAAAFSNDFSSLVFTMRRLSQGDPFGEDLLAEGDTGYSPALFEVMQDLDMMAWPSRRTTSEPLDLVEIMSMVEDGISRAVEVTDDSVRRFMPVPTSTTPSLYDEQAQALEAGASIVGPWQLAAVNSKTWKLVKVFPGFHATPKPRSTGKQAPQIPTDSNPAAGGMAYSQYLKLKKDEASAPPELESPVPGMEAEDDVYEMTSSDERLMGMR